MKRMLLATIAIAGMLAAGSASAELRNGTNYYGQNQDPYTHQGYLEPQGFPPPGQGPSAPYAYGQSYGSYGYQNMGPGCSSSFNATPTATSAQSRCKQNNVPIYAVVGGQAFGAVLNFLNTRKALDVAREGQQLNAGVAMVAVQQQPQSAQGAYRPLMQMRPCSTPRGIEYCAVVVTPTSQAYPIPSR